MRWTMGDFVKDQPKILDNLVVAWTINYENYTPQN